MIGVYRNLWGLASSKRAQLIHSLHLGFGLVALFWILGPNANSVKGQNYSDAIGIPPFTVELPVENGFINALNGDLHLEIPVGSDAERAGRQFKAVLMYDSNIWEDLGGYFDPYNGFYSNSFNIAGGWRLVTSADPGRIWSTVVASRECVIGKNDYGEGQVTHSNYSYVEPDGTGHAFPLIKIVQDIPTPCNFTGTISNADEIAPDGSGFHMVVKNYGVSVHGPDGTLNMVNDSNGNYNSFSFNASGGYDLWSDSLGRPLITSTTNGNHIYFDVLNSQGTTSRYTVTTGLIALNAYGYSNSAYPVVESIQLPDLTSYQFGYQAQYGMLASMTLPTGGQVSYTYSPSPVQVGLQGIHTRISPGSTTPWTYTFQTVTPCTTTNAGQSRYTVQKPSGDNEVYTLYCPSPATAGPWPTQVQYYSGSISSANLLATISKEYDFSHLICGNYQNGFCYSVLDVVRTAESTILPLSGGTSLTQRTEFSWDSGGSGGSMQYGQLLQKREWNFYSGARPTNPDRTTNFTYLNGSAYLAANILNRPTNVTVTNSSGGTVAQTVNCYDYAGGCGGSSFASATGMTNHDDTNYGTTNTVRGDLTQVQKLISGTSNYLTKSMTYDITGQLRTATDWSNLSTHTTTYDYTDHYVDDNTSNTEPLAGHSLSQATNGYPTTITAPLSAASTTYAYYYGTGQQSSKTDANSKAWYSHFGDSLNRPTSTKQPNGGWTYSPYPSAAKTPLDVGTGITSATLSTTCTGVGDCRHDQTQLDSLGRAIHALLVSDPDTQTGVDTTYDSNGRVHSVSNPHRSASQPTDGTETYSAYDGLDRKLQVTRADGSVAHTYYGAAVSSNGGRSAQLCSGYGLGYPVLGVDEAGKKRQSWTDGFGRLIEVDEPDSTNTLSVGTCYAYDLNDNLTGVRSLGGTEVA